MDRRTVWAILLMMVIAVAPALFLKKPAAGPTGPGDSLSVAGPEAVPETTPGPADSGRTLAPASETARPAPSDSAPGAATTAAASTETAREDTIRVTSPLYTYGVSTRGGVLVQAEFHRYASMAPGEERQRAQILPQGSDLLGLTVVRGRDTIDFRDASFTPSADSLSVNGERTLRLGAE
jgi:hypothetical protein